ncbi:hypothetical protein RHOSPDRAFT_31485 [Rhodotorula sp. JG-1b]|nr:hypothetical protein RHOSPDRAFT_31485 [Rhodotorula sp. JG-1b]
MDGEVPYSQAFLDRLFAGPSTLVGLVPPIQPFKDLLAAVGRVKTMLGSVKDLEVGRVYMIWSHRGDLLGEKECDDIIDIDFYEMSLQILSIEDLHVGISYHISDLFEGSLVHSIAGVELLNSREKEDWERAYEQGKRAAPDLIESVRARTDYTEEEKINLEEMINRTTLHSSSPDWPGRTEEELADLNPGEHGLHLERLLVILWTALARVGNLERRTELFRLFQRLPMTVSEWRDYDRSDDHVTGVVGQLERLSVSTAASQPDQEVFDEADIQSLINLAKGRAKDTLNEDYVARRNAVDFGVPLINNPLIADLYVKALGRKMKLGEVGPVSNYVEGRVPSMVKASFPEEVIFLSSLSLHRTTSGTEAFLHTQPNLDLKDPTTFEIPKSSMNTLAAFTSPLGSLHFAHPSATSALFQSAADRTTTATYNGAGSIGQFEAPRRVPQPQPPSPSSPPPPSSPTGRASRFGFKRRTSRTTEAGNTITTTTTAAIRAPLEISSPVFVSWSNPMACTAFLNSLSAAAAAVEKEKEEEKLDVPLSPLARARAAAAPSVPCSACCRTFASSSRSSNPIPTAPNAKHGHEKAAVAPGTAAAAAPTSTTDLLQLFDEIEQMVPEQVDPASQVSVLRHLSRDQVISPQQLSPRNLLQPYPPRPDFSQAFPLGPPTAYAHTHDPFIRYGLDPVEDAQLNPSLLSEFVTTMGKIKPRGKTGLQRKTQRKVGKAIRRARSMGIMPTFGISVPGSGREQ